MTFHCSVNYDHPRVIRWCHDQDMPGTPENFGKPWTETDDIRLIQVHGKNWPILAIARFLKRNCFAIVCRLQHHNLDWRKVMVEYRKSPMGEIRSDRHIADVVITGQRHDMVWFDESSNFLVGDWGKIHDHVKSNFPFHPKEKPMKRNINGRFWMIQNGNIKVGPTGQDVSDKHGCSMVEWPGRSIFPTKAEAVEAATAMAEQFPDGKFYVMESVAMYEAAKPIINQTTWKRSQ